MFRSIATIALIALSVTAAQAGESKVRFSDLDLASPAGMQTLKGRIHDAAMAACTPAALDFGVSAARVYEAEHAQKTCVTRLSEVTLVKVRSLASAARPAFLKLAAK